MCCLAVCWTRLDRCTAVGIVRALADRGCDYHQQGDTVSDDKLKFDREALDKLPAEKQHSPLTNQRGSARAPGDSVFGTWVMFRPDPAEGMSPDRCNTITAQPGTQDVRSEPLETLPSDPGWPKVVGCDVGRRGESDDDIVDAAQLQVPKSCWRSRRFLSIAAIILIAGTSIGYRSVHDTRVLLRQGRDLESDL